MARGVSRGDIWLHRFATPDKRRPVLVLSRAEALEVLRSAIVAPITSTIRGLPSEVVVGTGHGLKQESAINLDHVQTVRQEDLKKYVATLPPDVMRRVCGALAVATGCGSD
jgi:mRNA interferase MazF